MNETYDPNPKTALPQHFLISALEPHAPISPPSTQKYLTIQMPIKQKTLAQW